MSAMLLALGLGIMLYPKISDSINRMHSSEAVQSYSEQFCSASEAELQRQLCTAQEYNERLLSVADISEDSGADYYDILNFDSGMMGYIDIPDIDVRLPIYHGTDSKVLSKGVGHMPQTAFPIGGEGNHSVLTGHTGLPGAELFTDLYKLDIGDTFSVTVMNETLTYEVDRIKTVLPTDSTELLPVEGEDYCTLLTCTPYGINSHRLLVRGHRTDGEGLQEDEAAFANGSKTAAAPPAAFVVISALSVLVTAWLALHRKRHKPQKT